MKQMKLKFRHQAFQADAALAVCDAFTGQPYRSPTYMIDPGIDHSVQVKIQDSAAFTGFNNAPIIIDDNKILENIQKVQRSNGIKPSDSLYGKYNLTIEMETGVGKTYTYIKTMYELNKRYGWSKFIVVVPSVAIREGVYKSFQITEEHFTEEYGKKIRYFIYDSSDLTSIDRFASDSNLNVMIINSQACNSPQFDKKTGKLINNQRNKIFMKLEGFRSRRPIDIIASTNPIMIIDEPQSVEGVKTKEALKQFAPLFTLRYSATHRADSIYNMIYRLDAIDAYNKRLVKKIAVKGISVTGTTATEGYVYVQEIRVFTDRYPQALIEIDVKTSSGTSKKALWMTEGDNLYSKSRELDQYKIGFTIKRIDGSDSSVEFLNGKRLYAGEAIGIVNEDQMRRIQIRETILSHIERERHLFPKDIKVLSLFFIDEVSKYKQYDERGKAQSGIYAKIFEEEYNEILSNMQQTFFDYPEYLSYLKKNAPEQTHAGYFSIDKKSRRMVDSKVDDRTEQTSDDVDAYDLIMKDKERLLDLREPVRFIFSHSALREGWDNPNVFQICTLKQSGSYVRKRQEVGRGLRLAVNQFGERMDENVLTQNEVHNTNVLTVIASESYESFAKSLQNEIAEAVADRPRKVEAKLFTEVFGEDAGYIIYESLIENSYVKRGELTDKYYNDKKDNKLIMPKEVEGRLTDIISILDSVYDPRTTMPENARSNTVELSLNTDKYFSKAFQELWKQIRSKSYYIVSFDENELIEKTVDELNMRLRVSKVYFKVETGIQADRIESKEQLLTGEGFIRQNAIREDAYQNTQIKASSSVRYDLIGKISSETGLTRKAVARILCKLDKPIFGQFKFNPEEYIIRASNIINEQKARIIIDNIAYGKLTEVFDDNVIKEPEHRKGQLNVSAMPAMRHLYNYIIYDSNKERDFAAELEAHSEEVEVYIKLPYGFSINTPLGKYTPDWAIAFKEGAVKHIYFVAETKGDDSPIELRDVEKAKAHCAKEHFKAISGNNVLYEIVDSYEKLWNMVKIN